MSKSLVMLQWLLSRLRPTAPEPPRFRRERADDFADVVEALCEEAETGRGLTRGGHVISLTRLDGSRLVVNCDLITTLESTPDTVVTLLNGSRIMVREPVDDVVERVVAFRRRLRASEPETKG